MKIVFDATKNTANIAKHGFSLDAFEQMEADTVHFKVDDRQDYGEQRIRAYGMLDGYLCMAVFTMRNDECRVISFRRCNAKERKEYDEK